MVLGMVASAKEPLSFELQSLYSRDPSGHMNITKYKAWVSTEVGCNLESGRTVI